jgi:hypothetical protein
MLESEQSEEDVGLDEDLDEATEESPVEDETPVVRSQVSHAADDDDANSAILAALGPTKVVNKPDISRLNPCWIDGKWTPKEGDKIVMEVNTTGGKWLHTREYFIRVLNTETGNMTLWNEELGQYAGGNFKTVTEAGPVFKMAPGRGRAIGAKRRGRPPKDPTAVKEAKPLVFDSQGNVVKPKRGRPKGSPSSPG